MCLDRSFRVNCYVIRIKIKGWGLHTQVAHTHMQKHTADCTTCTYCTHYKQHTHCTPYGHYTLSTHITVHKPPLSFIIVEANRSDLRNNFCNFKQLILPFSDVSSFVLALNKTVLVMVHAIYQGSLKLI